ncbi:MAG: hypothetical protein WAW17_14055 [Rhodococcus sp. (in: high G+C Gram-positive bacteria)]|uniref:hypothetical protein n=1 Tax=Rhodococcus sp. TaxID=1831 RepID=UPI003BB03D83
MSRTTSRRNGLSATSPEIAASPRHPVGPTLSIAAIAAVAATAPAVVVTGSALVGIATSLAVLGSVTLAGLLI